MIPWWDLAEDLENLGVFRVLLNIFMLAVLVKHFFGRYSFVSCKVIVIGAAVILECIFCPRKIVPSKAFVGCLFFSGIFFYQNYMGEYRKARNQDPEKKSKSVFRWTVMYGFWTLLCLSPFSLGEKTLGGDINDGFFPFTLRSIYRWIKMPTCSLTKASYKPILFAP